MVLLHKALAPQRSAQYLTNGLDRIGGLVISAEHGRTACTPADVIEAHGLGWNGSPFHWDAPWLDVLEFTSPRTATLVDSPGGPVPRWWLHHSRLTPGARMVRLWPDGTAVVLATYTDVGAGWMSHDPEIPHPTMPRLSRCVGPVAQWEGAYIEADVIDEGATVVLAQSSPPLTHTGFVRGVGGRWYTRVPRDQVVELFELSMHARWQSYAVRVVDTWQGGGGHQAARVSMWEPASGPIGALVEVEPGLLEGVVRFNELTELTTVSKTSGAWTLTY